MRREEGLGLSLRNPDSGQLEDEPAGRRKGVTREVGGKVREGGKKTLHGTSQVGKDRPRVRDTNLSFSSTNV